ncbi:MAG: DUF1080 domain-containing protein [Isosphaeraceae bacterium]
MKRWLMIAAAACPGLLLSPSTARPSEPGRTDPAGWRSLFDGKTLEGWQHVGPGRFVVEDGVLRTEGGMGLLWFEREKLGDCVLRVVYRTANRRSNSGVYIRIADRPKDPWFAVHHGFEVQIAETAQPGRGTGSIYTFARAAANPARVGEWNTLEITLQGQKIATVINGVPVSEFDAGGLEPQAKDTIGEGDPARGPGRRPATSASRTTTTTRSSSSRRSPSDPSGTRGRDAEGPAAVAGGEKTARELSRSSEKGSRPDPSESEPEASATAQAGRWQAGRR